MQSNERKSSDSDRSKEACGEAGDIQNSTDSSPGYLQQAKNSSTVETFTWTNSIIAICSVVFVMFSVYPATIFIQFPLITFAFLAPNLFRTLHDKFMFIWLRVTEFVIANVMGVKIRQFGDQFLPAPNHTSLLIINHRTQFDWLFAWGLGDPMHQAKMVSKDSLTTLPGSGWAMQCASFLFLRRRLATDKDRIEMTTDYLRQTIGRYRILLWPEGTNLEECTLEVSNRFAAKNNLPPTQYTLHPRSVGFINLVHNMRKAGLTYIYDITIAFPDITPNPITKLLRGGIPKEVHYLVRRYSFEDVLGEFADVDDHQNGDETSREQIDSRLTSWLADRWREKERLLKEYYNGDRSFAMFGVNNNPSCYPQSAIYTLDSSGRRHLNLLGWATLVFWFLSLPYFIYKLVTSLTVFIVGLVVQLVYLYVTFKTDGFQSIIARWKLGR